MGDEPRRDVTREIDDARAEAAIARAEAALRARAEDFRQAAHARLNALLASGGFSLGGVLETLPPPERSFPERSFQRSPPTDFPEALSSPLPALDRMGLHEAAAVWRPFLPERGEGLSSPRVSGGFVPELMRFLQEMKEQAGSYGLAVVSLLAAALITALSRGAPRDETANALCHLAILRLAQLLQAGEATRLAAQDRHILLALRRLVST